MFVKLPKNATAPVSSLSDPVVKLVMRSEADDVDCESKAVFAVNWYVSTPVPPVMTSAPVPPAMVSVPPPPTNESIPAPPVKESLPKPPLIVSAPVLPASTSLPAPPVIAAPTVDTVWPVNVTLPVTADMSTVVRAKVPLAVTVLACAPVTVRVLTEPVVAVVSTMPTERASVLFVNAKLLMVTVSRPVDVSVVAAIVVPVAVVEAPTETVVLSVVPAVHAALATVTAPPVGMVAVAPLAKPVKEPPVASKRTAATVLVVVDKTTALPADKRTDSKPEILAPVVAEIAVLVLRVSVPSPPAMVWMAAMVSMRTVSLPPSMLTDIFDVAGAVMAMSCAPVSDVMVPVTVAEAPDRVAARTEATSPVMFNVVSSVSTNVTLVVEEPEAEPELTTLSVSIPFMVTVAAEPVVVPTLLRVIVAESAKPATAAAAMVTTVLELVPVTSTAGIAASAE